MTCCPFCEGHGWLVAFAVNGNAIRVPCTECGGGIGIPASADDHLATRVVGRKRKPKPKQVRTKEGAA